MNVIRLARWAFTAAAVLCSSAQATVLDSFTEPASATTGWVGGTERFVAYSGTEPVGGMRVISARDGYSGVMGGASRASVSGGSFVAQTNGGVTAAEATIYYGSAINGGGFVGSALGLGWNAADTFELDVSSMGGGFRIDLFGSNGAQAMYGFSTVAAGTYLATLSSFTGIQLLAGATISGIRISVGQIGGTGVALDEVRLNQVSSVPEPETWALMAAGLGAVGSLARRRHRRLAAR